MRQRKLALHYKVRLFFNKMIYGQPKLCGKYSAESKARSVTLDSFNCEKCTPEEIEKSKMEQDWFNQLTPDLISLAETDYDALLEVLNNPKGPNTALTKAFKKYKDKYG
jgi:hypothetical protein